MEKYQLHFLYDYVFPNHILPNALITELAIIDYMSTIHTNKNRHSTLFENISGFNDQTPVSDLFGTSLGSWPNSVSGSHLAKPCYDHVLSYSQNSLFLAKENGVRKYVYVISLTPHIDAFVGKVRTGSKLHGEYFWKHMSAEALEDVRRRNAVIFLDYGEENFVDKEEYIALHNALEYSGIPKEQIILGFNSFNAQEVYENWFAPEERRLEVKSWPFMITNCSYNFNRNPHNRMIVDTLNLTRSVYRTNNFLFKIRRPRPHRLALLYKMASDDLLKHGDWSCLTPVTYNEREVTDITNRFGIEVNHEAVKAVCSQTPKSLIAEPTRTYGNTGGWTDTNADAQRDSYLYICTETYIGGEYKSFTEKVFKPMANFQPFIFVAFPNCLKLLRELGFKTFSPWIDESYDNESNEDKRLQMIYNEIAKIAKMDKSTIHRWYWEMEEILLHNHHRLMEYHLNDQMGLDLIKTLADKTRQ